MRETMKHLSEEDLILIYYNEPGPSAEMRTHASECAECRDAAAERECGPVAPDLGRDGLALLGSQCHRGFDNPLHQFL